MKLNPLFAVLLAGSLVACGGGTGSSNSSSSQSSTPSQASATVAQGMVSGFGSVIVNGVHYDVKDAQINFDSESQVESDLEVGHMVHVIGTIDADGLHGKATKLIGESQLIGAIDAIDLSAGTISALGQTIVFNGDTFFKEGLTADALKVGDIIQVSGFFNADGQLVATHIKTKTSLPENNMQLTGVVADLDTTAKTFTLNGKTVDYSAAILTDLPDGALANGQRVCLHGKIVNDVFTVVGNIRLSALDIHSDHGITEHLKLELEGMASDVVAGTSFKLGDLTVLVNADTQYKEGTVTDLINGARVKVAGKLNADRNLVAAEVKFRVTPQVAETGTVQSIDLTNNTFVVNNITFEVKPDTSVKDEGLARVHLFNISSLAVGDLVHVRGYKVLGDSTTADRFVATVVIRENPNDDSNRELGVELQGLIDGLDGKVITILNHNIELNSFTKFEGFENLDLFLANAVGSRIEVVAVMDGGRLLARKISLIVGIHHSESSHSMMSAHSEMSHAMSSAHSEPTHSEPSHSESSHAESSHAESSHTESSHAESSNAEVSTASQSSSSQI